MPDIMQEKLEQKYQDVIHQLIPVNSLSPMFQEHLIHQAEIVKIPMGNRLFEQGEKCGSLYYLLSGDVDTFTDNVLVKTISAGTESSRSAINQNFSFSATTKSQVILLIVKQALVERLVILDGKVDLVDMANFEMSTDWMTQVLSSEVFAKVPPANMSRMFKQLDEISVKKGDQVITQNMAGNYFYIIKEGRCVETRKCIDTDETITLAELEVGNCFGEEALLSDQNRMTTVTMLTDGRMMRLAKNDYDELTKLSSVKKVNFEQVSSAASQETVWLDVRFKDEFSKSHLRHSQNIPFDQFEVELTELSREQSYILYCDTGIRSAVAADWLSEKGFDVAYLIGGIRQYSGESSMTEKLVDGLSDSLKDDQETINRLPEKYGEITESMGEQIMAVDQRIRDLKEMFSTESILAKEWLETDPPMEDFGVLIEARKKIDQIESNPTPSLHEKAGDSINGDFKVLRKQLETAQHHLEEERSRIARQETGPEQQELILKRVSDELEAIKNRLRYQEKYDLKRRESFEIQLATERKKMHEQLAHFSLGLEQQQSRDMEIEKMHHATALQTRQIIEKFKDAQKQYSLRQQKKHSNGEKAITGTNRTSDCKSSSGAGRKATGSGIITHSSETIE